jgi:hypothetical protein
MFDELNGTNTVLRGLLGVAPLAMREPATSAVQYVSHCSVLTHTSRIVNGHAYSLFPFSLFSTTFTSLLFYSVPVC